MEVVASVLVWVFLFSLGLFAYGLVRPQAGMFKKGFRGSITRPKLAKVFIPALVALLVMIGAVSPAQSQQSGKKAEREPAATASAEVAKVESAQSNKYYEVTDVVDGDTIKVKVQGKIETIRFIGIDTPESVHPSKPVECFGLEASAHMKSLVAGKKVRLEQDKSQSDRDKYRRLLRYVYLQDNTHVNLRMIADGYAYEYTYASNPYQYQAEFKAAQASASAAGLGLWAESTCGGERTAPQTLGAQDSASVPAQPQRVQAAQQPAAAAAAPAPAPSPQSSPAQASEPVSAPAPTPIPTPMASECDPNYTPCLPRISKNPGCKKIGHRVIVVGNDHLGLDGDDDGIGCEMYW